MKSLRSPSHNRNRRTKNVANVALSPFGQGRGHIAVAARDKSELWK
jgi:hypothetical protein